MSEREQLIAYLATLACLATVFIAALVTAALVPNMVSKMEIFGLGTITGGLIGVLRLPVIHAPANNVEKADTVVQERPKEEP